MHRSLSQAELFLVLYDVCPITNNTQCDELSFTDTNINVSKDVNIIEFLSMRYMSVYN